MVRWLKWHNARPIFDVFSRKVKANSADDNVVIKLPLSDLTYSWLIVLAYLDG